MNSDGPFELTLEQLVAHSPCIAVGQLMSSETPDGSELCVQAYNIQEWIRGTHHALGRHDIEPHGSHLARRRKLRRMTEPVHVQNFPVFRNAVYKSDVSSPRRILFFLETDTGQEFTAHGAVEELSRLDEVKRLATRLELPQQKGTPAYDIVKRSRGLEIEWINHLRVRAFDTVMMIASSTIFVLFIALLLQSWWVIVIMAAAGVGWFVSFRRQAQERKYEWIRLGIDIDEDGLLLEFDDNQVIVYWHENPRVERVGRDVNIETDTRSILLRRSPTPIEAGFLHAHVEALIFQQSRKLLPR